MTSARLVAGLLLAVLVCGVSGCAINEDIAGETIRYTHAWSSIGATFGLSLGLLVGGFFLARGTGRLSGYGWVMLIIAAMLLVGVAPGMLIGEVTVTKDKLMANDCFVWFWQSPKTVEFADVSAINTEIRLRRGRRGRQEKTEYVVFVKKSGGTIPVELTRLVVKAAPAILSVAEARDIPVNLEPNVIGP
jgi:MFS family permease